MAKTFDAIMEVASDSLQNYLTAGTVGTTADNSIFKTAMAEILVDYAKNDTVQDKFKDFTSFVGDWTNAKVQALAPMPILSGNAFSDYKFQYAVNRGGFIRGTSHVECTSIPMTQCSAQGSCATMGGMIGNVGAELADIEFKKETFNFEICVSDALAYTGVNLYTDLLYRATGLSVGESESLGMAIADATVSIIEKTEAERHILENYSDNGMVAIVKSAGTTTANGVEFSVNRTDLLWYKRDYAVMRPTGQEAGDECTPYCYRAVQLLGFVEVMQVPNRQTLKVSLGRAFDRNGNQMPAVTLADGDLLVALDGTYHTYTGGGFGGGSYSMYDPMSGYDADQITGAITAPSCCNLNGWYEPLRLKYEVDNSLVTKYWGLTISKYSGLLTPQVFDTCCGTGNTTKLTPDWLMQGIRYVESIVDVAKEAGWYSPALENPVIVIDVAPFTSEEVKTSLLANYPGWNAQKMIQDQGGKFEVFVNQAVPVNVNLTGIAKYPVKIRENYKGVPEGEVRVGLEKPYLTMVSKGVVTMDGSDWNGANLVKGIPSGAPTDLTTEMAKQYRASYLFHTNNSCDLPTTKVKWNASRYLNRFQPLIGANYYIRNVFYKKPLDCVGTCSANSCATC